MDRQYSTNAPLAGNGRIGDATLRSLAECRAIKRAYLQRSNPNAFYCIVDPRERSKISWSHNTRLHFGKEGLTYDTFFTRVHPYWRDIYHGLEKSTMAILNDLQGEEEIKKLALVAHVPLLGISGEYFWYSQVSFPASFNSKAQMVEYLNEFHRLAPFNNIIPRPPEVTVLGRPKRPYGDFIRKQSAVLLNQQLVKLLSATNFRVLFAYRELLWATDKAPRENVAKRLGMAVSALDKANTRTLNQARVMFPAPVLTGISDLARFTNSMFGPPLEM